MYQRINGVIPDSIISGDARSAATTLRCAQWQVFGNARS